MKNSILIIPPHEWYMTNYAEYLIRYLSDEFFIEIGFVPYPPYRNFLDRFPETSPFMRNPDDYDLLYPLLPTHWGVVDKDKYAHKVATVFFQPNEGRYKDVAVVGAFTPLASKSFGDFPHHNLMFGIDTELLQPYPMKREDDLLHVGMVGTHSNPRRMIKEYVMPLYDLEGVRIMFFPNSWENDGGHIYEWGGKEFVKRVVTGGKHGAGIANIYNRLDVLLRCDCDPAVSFPVLEAAACGVPCVTNDLGIDHLITEAGGGILIPGNRDYYINEHKKVAGEIRKAIIWMRDHPEERKEMGWKAREEIVRNWKWADFIDGWRKFFREGIKHANRNFR